MNQNNLIKGLKIRVKNKVDSKEWLLGTCEVEGPNNIDLVLNHPMLQNIGELGLDYYELYYFDTIIGRCCTGYLEEDNCNHIWSFQINKEYRNNGLGKYLLSTVISRLGGYNDLRLSSKNPKMLSLAESFGFEYYKTIINDITNEDGEIVMIKRAKNK